MTPSHSAGESKAPELTLDYRSAFELSPIACALSRDRIIVECNLKFLAIFRTQREAVIGRSFEIFFPSSEEFERTGRRIASAVSSSETGGYVDERVMRRPGDGSLFWCHVWGHALDRSRPHAAAIWSLDDMSATRPIAVALTPREREIGALLVEGLTSKLVARRLGLSHRTVEIYRSRLLRKHGVDTATGLVRKLIADAPTNLAA